MQTNLPNIFAIVLNYRNYEVTIECICSLLAAAEMPITVIVVDNASGNNSISIISKELEKREIIQKDVEKKIPHRSNIIFVQNERNTGYAAGNNVGLRIALANGAEYVIIANSDIKPCAGFLLPMLKCAQSDPGIGVVGPKILTKNGEVDRYCTRRRPGLGWAFFCIGIGRKLFPGNKWEQEHFYLNESKLSKRAPIDIVSGSCFLITAKALNSIGLFDEGTFLYLEEFILHEQLCKKGYKTMFEPASIVIHLHGASTKGEGQKRMREIERRSLTYYWRVHRGYNNLMVLLLLALSSRPIDWRKLFGSSAI